MIMDAVRPFSNTALLRAMLDYVILCYWWAVPQALLHTHHEYVSIGHTLNTIHAKNQAEHTEGNTLSWCLQYKSLESFDTTYKKNNTDVQAYYVYKTRALADLCTWKHVSSPCKLANRGRNVGTLQIRLFLADFSTSSLTEWYEADTSSFCQEFLQKGQNKC